MIDLIDLPRLAPPFSLPGDEGTPAAPFCICAAQVYVPGAVAAEVHVPGPAAAEVYVPGSAASQVNCDC